MCLGRIIEGVEGHVNMLGEMLRGSEKGRGLIGFVALEYRWSYLRVIPPRNRWYQERMKNIV